MGEAPLDPGAVGRVLAGNTRILFGGLSGVILRMNPSARRRPQPSFGPAAPVSAKLVLLVDSHEDSRTIYTAILEHHGFAVAAAASGDEGVKVARERQPDLIVVEFSPPRQRSLEIIRALRTLAAAAVPIVALSTTLGDADRELLYGEGVAGYMVKPCPPLTLLAEARRLLAG